MIYVFLIWNIAVFFIYALDKLFAKKELWRIKESLLIVIAFLYGAAGALCSMVIFRHKIRKWKFKILIPTALIINALMLYFGFKLI